MPSHASSKEGRVAKGKVSNLRTKDTIRRLNMQKRTAKYNKDGKKIAGDFQMRDQVANRDIVGKRVQRIAPNRKWFGNTRAVGQEELDTFRDIMEKKQDDPYTVVLRSKKLPMGLLQDAQRTEHMNLLTTTPFDKVFSKAGSRKRPNLSYSGLGDMVKKTQEQADGYDEKDDSNIVQISDGVREEVSEKVFDKGQSKRIWGELYKVLDCSDIVVQVLDARNPMGTRSKRVENHIKKNAKHKHLIFVLNKVDLVPTWVTKQWLSILSKDFPTLAFHASLTNSFGKGSLIGLLKQFAKLHTEKKEISVGFIGYPNVGKSSVINSLKSKKVCKVAPIPGETKVWQYITLFRRVFLIDCPGVVPSDEAGSEQECVLKGVVRAERLPDPVIFIKAILERVQPNHLYNAYGVEPCLNEFEFLERLARKSGRLLKGNAPDYRTVAQMIICDWQRGRLPFFFPPSEELLKNAKGKADADSGPLAMPTQEFNKLNVMHSFGSKDGVKNNMAKDMEDKFEHEKIDETDDEEEEKESNDSAEIEEEEEEEECVEPPTKKSRVEETENKEEEDVDWDDLEL
eukprot:TRINITY_DN171_c2_g1_i1.p1 TRINITY_DN171_c2_g1~~TRINITY_DN171_c2_g1_i1.p1  ORF type:complete len:569 (+),score=221.88 TRINITY_DN171_c2_g1_i1:92-1798(+)